MHQDFMIDENGIHPVRDVLISFHQNGQVVCRWLSPLDVNLHKKVTNGEIVEYTYGGKSAKLLQGDDDYIDTVYIGATRSEPDFPDDRN